MKRGDFIRLEYTGRVSSTGEIFDLTSEEEAKKQGLFKSGYKYGPVLVIMGAGMIIPGVEKQLETMKPGDEKEFAVKPEEAFGLRNPALIKIVSVSQFRRSEKPFNPVPGMFVTINGRQARIQSVSGGRVRVDFNHPLAGKELKYRIRVTGTITKPQEQANSILEYYRVSGEATLETGKLGIKTEKEMPKPARKLLRETIMEWVKGIKTVEFSSSKKTPSENSKNKKTGDSTKNST